MLTYKNEMLSRNVEILEVIRNKTVDQIQFIYSAFWTEHNTFLNFEQAVQAVVKDRKILSVDSKIWIRYELDYRVEWIYQM